MSTVAKVKLWGTVIGYVSLEDGSNVARFEYDEGFLYSGIEVAPLMMPLSGQVYSFANLPQQLMAMDDPMDAMPVDESGMPMPTGEAPEEQPEIQITFRRDHEKIGRNDPCPCGSGKKFKKCCGK